MNKILKIFKYYLNRIKKIIKYSFLISTSLLTFFLIFISDELILKLENNLVKIDWVLKMDNSYKPLFYKSLIFILSFVLMAIAFVLFYIFRRKIKLNGNDFSVEIRYGDLFNIKDCICVVNSDECFTSTIGDRQEDIKASSIYGQYLTKHPNLNISTIISDNQVVPENRYSKFKNKVCYKPGTILYNDDALILAFARLDEDGCAMFESLEDYLNCLSFMWEEIRAKHGDRNVVIPVLGSGRTKIKDVSLTEQEILDYFIQSYKLSCYKLQRNYKLIICCRKGDILLENIKSI